MIFTSLIMMLVVLYLCRGIIWNVLPAIGWMIYVFFKWIMMTVIPTIGWILYTIFRGIFIGLRTLGYGFYIVFTYFSTGLTEQRLNLAKDLLRRLSAAIGHWILVTLCRKIASFVIRKLFQDLPHLVKNALTTLVHSMLVNLILKLIKKLKGPRRNPDCHCRGRPLCRRALHLYTPLPTLPNYPPFAPNPYYPPVLLPPALPFAVAPPPLLMAAPPPPLMAAPLPPPPLAPFLPLAGPAPAAAGNVPYRTRSGRVSRAPARYGFN